MQNTRKQNISKDSKGECSHARSHLLVFAHQDEAQAFGDVEHTITGVGKINAAVNLAHALTQLGEGCSQSEVLVMGTAGAVADTVRFDAVAQIVRVLQHDFSLDSKPYELDTTPPKHSPSIQQLTIATGDQFVTSDKKRAHIASLPAQLVDMESYAYAAVCAQFGIPLRIFKIPSDFADSKTTMADWDAIVHEKSQQLYEFYTRILCADRQ